MKIFNKKDNIFKENKEVFIDKTFTDNNNIFTDDDKLKYKFLDFSRNKKYLFLVLIITFIFTSITVIKTFIFRNKVSNYEEAFTRITYKESEEANIYNENIVVDENIKEGAASKLSNCLKKQVNIEDLPSSVTSKIDEIVSFYNQSYNHFSYKYIDLYTGFSVSYNEHQQIFAASSIKAPTDIYIFEMAGQGKIDLNEKMTYTGNYYNTGSGVLKNKKINTSYDIHTLLNYSTVTSDNAAHNMLEDKYGRVNMLNFWRDKGTEVIFTANNNWGPTSAHDAGIYMKELYNFYLNDSKYGDEVMNNFLQSYPKFLKGNGTVKIASKSGWSGSSLHDVSIIFADNPYIVVALSNLGDKGYNYYFEKVNSLTWELHTEYWKYKMDICGDINQY